MAAVTLGNTINSVSSSALSQCLLPKEKLQEIAKVLEEESGQFGFDYRNVTLEQLPSLQEYCFKIVFKMCENGDKKTIEKIHQAVKGLKDLDGNTIFFRFIRGGKKAETNEALENQLDLAQMVSDQNNRNLTADVDHLENIVFAGSGFGGIACIGAIRVLEKRGVFVDVIRLAGTSICAIIAACLAVGFSTEELEILLNDTPFTYFCDHPFTSDRIERFIKDKASLATLKKLALPIISCVKQGSPIPLVTTIVSELLSSAWKSTGFYQGEVFLLWIETEIAKRTNTPYCTFRELAHKIAKKEMSPQNRHFKHLHLFATKIGQEPDTVCFSSEDEEYGDLIISEAIRASLPIIFEPHIPIFKKQTTDGKVEFCTQKKTFSSEKYEVLREAIRKGENKVESSYVGGDLIKKFHLDVFDKRKYIKKNCPKVERDFCKFNSHTLGFNFQSREDNSVHRELSAENIGDVIEGVYHVLRQAEKCFDKHDPRDADRVIILNTQNIGSFDFETNLREGKGKKAVEEAEKQVEEFFVRREERALALEKRNHAPPSAQSAQAVISRTHIRISKSTYLMQHSSYLAQDWFERYFHCVHTLINPLNFSIDGECQFQRKQLEKYKFYHNTLNDNRMLLFNRIKKVPWEAKRIFEQDTPFFSNPEFSKTHLFSIACTNEAEFIKFLVKHKIPVNIDCGGQPLLYEMLPYDCYDTFEALVNAEEGYVERTRDSEGNTLLHRAAELGKIKAYQILMQHHKVTPLLDIQNKAGKTAIVVAVQSGHLAFFRQLLIDYPEVDLTFRERGSGNTILHDLVMAGAEKEIFELFEKKPDVFDQIIALENQVADSILFKTQNHNILKLLIEKGIDLTKTQQETDKTLLYILAKNNDEELVKLFCEKLKEKHPEFYKNILDRQVKSSQLNSTMQRPRLKTALMIAAEKNNYKVVKILIEAGANFRQQVDGLTPLDCAPTLFRTESSQLLRQALRGNMDQALSSLEKLEALRFCCKEKDIEAAQRLIKTKIFPFEENRDAQGDGLLHIVIKSKYISRAEKHKLLCLLLQKGTHFNQIDVDYKNEKGNTALHYAAYGNYPETVEVLLNYAKPNMNIQNEKGKTPLHLVKDMKIAKLLIARGANPLIQDQLSRTPLFYANLSGNKALAEFLQKSEKLFL